MRKTVLATLALVALLAVGSAPASAGWCYNPWLNQYVWCYHHYYGHYNHYGRRGWGGGSGHRGFGAHGGGHYGGHHR